MIFTKHQFSKRFPAIDCAVFVVHEPAIGRDAELTQARKHRATAAAIVLPDGRTWIGVSICAQEDQFIKKVGRDKAIGRAFRHYCVPGSDISRLCLRISEKAFLEELKAFCAFAIERKKKDMGLL